VSLCSARSRPDHRRVVLIQWRKASAVASAWPLAARPPGSDLDCGFLWTGVVVVVTAVVVVVAAVVVVSSGRRRSRRR